MKNRNAVIDLCRFLFASIVLVFHIAIIDNGVDDRIFFSINTWNVTFFYKGFLGVEFFFLVSGYFLAHTVYKQRVSSDPETTPLGEETIKFLIKKIKAFYPYYCAGALSVALLCIYWIIIGRSNDIVYVLERIPSLLLLQRTGFFEKTYIGLAWYLSSMILAMAIVYPLVKNIMRYSQL